MRKNKPEATGYSVSFNFGEAFQNAVTNLPPPIPEHPDPGRNIVVISVGTYKGGTRPERAWKSQCALTGKRRTRRSALFPVPLASPLSWDVRMVS